MKQIKYIVREQHKSFIMLKHVVCIESIALKVKNGYWNLMLRIQRRYCDQL
jgi:hypothetical protein